MNARDETFVPEQTMLLTGNHAVAWAARLARPKVVPVYPITPQTPILEKITEFQADGVFDLGDGRRLDALFSEEVGRFGDDAITGGNRGIHGLERKYLLW